MRANVRLRDVFAVLVTLALLDSAGWLRFAVTLAVFTLDALVVLVACGCFTRHRPRWWVPLPGVRRPDRW